MYFQVSVMALLHLARWAVPKVLGEGGSRRQGLMSILPVSGSQCHDVGNIFVR